MLCVELSMEEQAILNNFEILVRFVSLLDSQISPHTTAFCGQMLSLEEVGSGRNPLKTMRQKSFRLQAILMTFHLQVQLLLSKV